MAFINERTIKATRKRHLCIACDKFIEIGEPAVNWAGVTDGDFSSVHYHPECRAAEIDYNHEYLGGGWPDEWACLRDCEPDDRPWIKANHPIAYLRMCRTREQHASAVAGDLP